MAIFSLHHSFIGRTTHPAGAASAYARYITRPEACTVIAGERMPLDRQVLAWLDKEEQGDRKNARVVDRLVVALPVELTREQNIELLQEFGARMTEGRAAWIAAIHDGPGDADNPHAHIVFRDRDFDTGRRVMMTSEPGSTQRFREAWEQEVNIALQRAGLEIRVDCRSLEAQGIDREPQLHVGAGAEALAAKQHEFRSTEKEITRLIDGVPTEVTINYPAIDEGRTRFEENEERKLRNRERALEELILNGPQRPGTDAALAMEKVFQATLRLDTQYRRAMRSGEVPPDDGDPITAVIREHIAERRAVQHGRGAAEPHAAPLEFGEAPAEPLPWAPRRGPYPSGPGKAITKESRDSSDAGEDSAERAPRRDATDLLAGAGLAAIGKIAESLESLFDGRTGLEIEKDEEAMADQRKIEQVTEQQQRQQEAELAKWRQVELNLYLAQRDRERHIDRGR